MLGSLRGREGRVDGDSPLQAEDDDYQGHRKEKDGAYLPYVGEAELEWSSGLHVWVKEKMQPAVLAGLAFSTRFLSC